MTDWAAGTSLPKSIEAPRLPDDLAACLDEKDLVAVFRHLPPTDQKNFIRWVAAGRPAAERAKRNEILRQALEVSSLAWESRPNLPNNGQL